MTAIQRERELYNIDEHGPFCECLLCLERDMQGVEMPSNGTSRIEQDLMAVLRGLPLDINIMRQKGHDGDEYRWSCLEASGKETSFVDATREALRSLVGVLQLQ